MLFISPHAFQRATQRRVPRKLLFKVAKVATRDGTYIIGDYKIIVHRRKVKTVLNRTGIAPTNLPIIYL